MAGQKESKKPEKVKQDDSVMATNNSSIVSKRSVERLYYPEPHFYRYFVKKPLRRSPLINRGYWLRMHAVEHVIRRFLDTPSQKQKVVLNLGCGYDPLAFQWLSKEIPSTQTAKFVDVDFPDLIAKKCHVIASTSQLRELLGHFDRSAESTGVFLRSEHYSALGCDLVDLARLEELLAGEINISSSLILCTAEVSITYMNAEAADALIQLMAHFEDIQFCLLEQFLPAGAEHPFAQKMIQHFNNLQTPLRSIHRYPLLTDQRRRFEMAGWTSTFASSLWDLWTDTTIVPPQQKLTLDRLEPFDEWEEFVLFAAHYSILVAAKPSDQSYSLLYQTDAQKNRVPGGLGETMSRDPSVVRSELIPNVNMRRFGALFSIAENILGHHGGLGSQARLGNLDLYGPSEYQTSHHFDVSGIEPRMCHTVSAAGRDASLLVGGRASPTRALKDCWILGEKSYRVDDLPTGLYRHCAAQIDIRHAGGSESGVLVYGGKTGEGLVSSRWLLWCNSAGWVKLKNTPSTLEPRFSAALTSTGPSTGLLIGGMNAYGNILSEIWEWTVLEDKEGTSIAVKRVRVSIRIPIFLDGQDLKFAEQDRSWPYRTDDVLGRMGACVVNSSQGLFLIGGVSARPLPRELEIMKLTILSHDGEGELVLSCSPLNIQLNCQRPLLVGHTALSYCGNIIIVGGGATCFSFGTYWNQELITLLTTADKKIDLVSLPNNPADTSLLTMHGKAKNISNALAIAPTKVEGIVVNSAQQFEHIVDRGHPVMFRQSKLGPCTTDWTLEGLKAKVGTVREVVVHESADPHLDFQRKNFRYVKKPFQRFIDEVGRGSKQYLRSIASDRPSDKPADFWSDFPELSHDFELPAEFYLAKEKMHSSVFRISGPVSMWLHYDVMANILCQIHGTKRLLLYPPDEVSLFSIPPGISSSSINCFNPDSSDASSLALAHPLEALLGPGDVLFIPALWLHTALPIDNVSISVNVFFRNLDNGYAPGRDVYGNRDVQAYEKGRKDIGKIVDSFAKLPPEMKKFYLHRLADELKGEAQKSAS